MDPYWAVYWRKEKEEKWDAKIQVMREKIMARSRNRGKGEKSQYLNRTEETVQNKQVRDINESVKRVHSVYKSRWLFQ